MLSLTPTPLTPSPLTLTIILSCIRKRKSPGCSEVQTKCDEGALFWQGTPRFKRRKIQVAPLAESLEAFIQMAIHGETLRNIDSAC